MPWAQWQGLPSSRSSSAGRPVVLISSMTVVPCSSSKMPSARPSMVNAMPSIVRVSVRKTSAWYPSPAAFWSRRWMRAPSLARSNPVKRLSMEPVLRKNSTSWRTASLISGMGFTSD